MKLPRGPIEYSVYFIGVGNGTRIFKFNDAFMAF